MKYILKAQKDNKVFTYRGHTKTDCMYEFDRHQLRRGFKFFMTQMLSDNVQMVESLPRDYPYSVSNLE